MHHNSTGVFELAEKSVRSPQQIYILNMKTDIYSIRAFNNKIVFFEININVHHQPTSFRRTQTSFTTSFSLLCAPATLFTCAQMRSAVNSLLNMMYHYIPRDFDPIHISYYHCSNVLFALYRRTSTY